MFRAPPRTTARLFILSASLGTACTPSLDVPGGTPIACATATDCPVDMRCVIEAQRCVTTASDDTTSPALLAANVTPTLVGPSALVHVSFSANEGLLAPPDVQLEAPGFRRPLTRTSADNHGPGFTYSYAVNGDEPEATVSVVATLIDTAGNTTADAAVGTVTFDFSAPIVSAVTPTPSQEHRSILWTDTVELELSVVYADGGDDIAAVEIEGDLLVGGGQTPGANLPVELNDGIGPKFLTLVALDSVGNRSEPFALSVWLDRGTPQAPLTISLPVSDDGEVWLNADALAVYFASSAASAPDFSTYVLSTDGGLSWSPITTPGIAILEPLAQNALTDLQIAERDVFGNLSTPESRAHLAVHEDSLPPPAPIANESRIVDPLSATVGIAMIPRPDDSGEPVTYEVQGGSTDFVSVGTEPLLDLNGLVGGGRSTFLVRVRDRAGNASPVVSIDVFPDALRKTGLADCSTYGCYKRVGHRAGGGTGVFVERALGSDDHAVHHCKPDSVGSLACGVVFDTTSTSIDFYSNVDTNGRNVVVQNGPGGGSSISVANLGGDGIADTGDETVFDFIGSMCPAIADNGIVYIRWIDGSLRFYGFGPDGAIGGGDDTGVIIVPAPSADPAIGSLCITSFNGQQMTWLDTRDSPSSDVYLYDFGPDRRPATTDDVGEVHVNDGLTRVVLADESLYIAHNSSPLRVIAFGPDGRFGTGDDQLFPAPQHVEDAYGDKLLTSNSTFGTSLFDVSSQRVVRFDNPGVGHGSAITGSIGAGLTFVAVSDRDGGDSSLAYVQEVVAARGYRSSPPSAKPHGAITEALVYYPRGNEHSLTSLRLGGNVELGYGEVFGRTSVDIEGHLVAFLDSDQVMLYDVGADMIPGSTDDRGPEALTSGPAEHHQPRISGHIVVWAVGGSIFAGGVSALEALDLGADGWLGGGDDVPYDVTAANGYAYSPDIAGSRIVWLDARNDGDKLCPSPATCNLDVYTTLLGSGIETALEVDPATQASVRIEGERVVWTDHREGNWDLFVHQIGGTTTQVTATAADEVLPCLAGNRLTFMTHQLGVIDAGSDGTLGTSDDFYLRQPAAGSASEDPLGIGDRAPRWCSDELMLLQGTLVPMVDDADLYSATATSTPIPDNNPTGVTLSLAVDEPDWKLVHDMRIRVAILHPNTSQLRVVLVSPSDDEVVLFDGVPSGTDLDATYSLRDTPRLMDHYGEPVTGTWSLRVIDDNAGATGVIDRWEIAHNF